MREMFWLVLVIDFCGAKNKVPSIFDFFNFRSGPICSFEINCLMISLRFISVSNSELFGQSLAFSRVMVSGLMPK